MTEKNGKGFDKNSNAYIILYSTVMVVVVAFLLAFIYQSLKPTQDANVALDKKRQVLASLNMEGLRDSEVEARYGEVVVADMIIDVDGNVTAEGTRGGENAGFLLTSADYKAGRLALFMCEIDGQTKYVIPVYGMGLWGSIWGYVAIDSDKSTVFGAYFNHESETAGLGAEIKDNAVWRAQFRGKKLFDDADTERTNIALAVRKPAEKTLPECEVDVVTGATLTSDGVTDMLADCLSKYKTFLNSDMEE